MLHWRDRQCDQDVGFLPHSSSDDRYFLSPFGNFNIFAFPTAWHSSVKPSFVESSNSGGVVNGFFHLSFRDTFDLFDVSPYVSLVACPSISQHICQTILSLSSSSLFLSDPHTHSVPFRLIFFFLVQSPCQNDSAHWGKELKDMTHFLIDRLSTSEKWETLDWQ